MNAPYPEKSATAWQRIGWKDHSGIAVPLFTLKSSTSLGIGEFTDLYPLIPWCKEVGFDVIQLLPLNDTGLDTSPYNALSAFALNPIYLGLKHLPHYQETDDTRALPTCTTMRGRSGGFPSTDGTSSKRQIITGGKNVFE